MKPKSINLESVSHIDMDTIRTGARETDYILFHGFRQNGKRPIRIRIPLSDVARGLRMAQTITARQAEAVERRQRAMEQMEMFG